MPIYCCTSGTGTEEPWKHGLPVYAEPFPTQEDDPNIINNNDYDHATDPAAAQASQNINTNRNFYTNVDMNQFDSTAQNPEPIRKLKHSEIVLVDEVSCYYDRLWLRLCWPGSRGGVAGYILLKGRHSEHDKVKAFKEQIKGAVGGLEECDHGESNPISIQMNLQPSTNKTSSDNDSDNESSPGSTEGEIRGPRCLRTGLYFPTTDTMQLLSEYDDGIEDAPSVAPITGEDGMDEDDIEGEPVFCRICREGLHDVDYDFEMEGQDVQRSSSQISGNNGDNNDLSLSRHETHENVSQTAQTQNSKKAPIRANHMNHPYAANPLMAPCECSGSMAFVHYLCIEQWRCRSHHPGAKNGLNCETCNKPYSLPPPPSRPEVNEEEDWLEAMPPHVLQALRNPHPCWQIGAAIVRRRWLRPLAPVISSPIVALYCRARRTLKKRGVSRRRWACSLCRRRARWKCVRCLRSYYCSRQCQNVSWHIVHKHVCYKPVRFWQSVALYGLSIIYFIPDVLSYTLLYDVGLSFLWLSFVITGVIGGGVATIMKKRVGVDIRGRVLELAVVLATLWLGSIGWGLIWAFFGEPEKCRGTFNFNAPYRNQTSNPELEYDRKFGIMSIYLTAYLFRPAKAALVQIDGLVFKALPSLISKWVCYRGISSEDISYKGCFELAKKADPDFLLKGFVGDCTSDANTIIVCCSLAIFMHFTNHMLKKLDRLRRAAVARPRHPRPHQD